MRTVAVGAEDGAEDSELEPAEVEILVGGVGCLVVIGGVVAGDVGCPVGHAGEGEVEAGGDLMGECPEAAVDVAGPDGGADSLLAEEGGAGEEEGALLVGGFSPVLLNAFVVEEGIDVGVEGSVADGELLVAKDGVAAVGPVLLGFGRVEPEGVPALGEEFAGETVPVDVAGPGAGGVVDAGVGDEEFLAVEFFVGV